MVILTSGSSQAHIKMYIGIDLGGTKTESIILDNKGNELERIRKSTPKNYNGTLDIVCELVNYLEDKYKSKCSVGVGSPGALSFENDCIKGGNSTWLNNRPLKKDLELRLNRNIFLENDLNFSILNLISILLSFIFSLITIKYFLIYIQSFSLKVFVIYRIILGIGILLFAYL